MSRHTLTHTDVHKYAHTASCRQREIRQTDRQREGRREAGQMSYESILIHSCARTHRQTDRQTHIHTRGASLKTGHMKAGRAHTRQTHTTPPRTCLTKCPQFCVHCLYIHGCIGGFHCDLTRVSLRCWVELRERERERERGERDREARRRKCDTSTRPADRPTDRPNHRRRHACMHICICAYAPASRPASLQGSLAGPLRAYGQKCK